MTGAIAIAALSYFATALFMLLSYQPPHLGHQIGKVMLIGPMVLLINKPLTKRESVGLCVVAGLMLLAIAQALYF